MTPPPTTRRRTGRFAGLLLAGTFALGATAAVPVAAQISGPKPVQIGLKALKFTPNKATAKVGQSINFVWQENLAHNIVIDAKHKSKTQTKGLWTTKFTKAGTYKYQCTLHPGMKGEITVK